MTYTKGPWTFDYSTWHYWFIEHQQGDETYTLTKLDCGEADARLIAAAPELLEVARQIVLAAEQQEGSIPSDIVSGAYAAILNATGKEI